MNACLIMSSSQISLCVFNDYRLSTKAFLAFDLAKPPYWSGNEGSK